MTPLRATFPDRTLIQSTLVQNAPTTLHFVQSLRVFLIVMVIAHHAGQPYGPTGGDWPVDDPVSTHWLGSFFALNAAFGMGLFFLLAGYFVEHSYQSKGFWRFVGSRLLRLGIPLLLLVVFAFGAIGYAESGSELGYLPYLITTYLGENKLEFGPLWFIAHLLVYQLVYAVIRLILSSANLSVPTLPAPGFVGVLTFATVLGLCSAAVRLSFHQDDWISVLGVIPAEPAHLPQYLSLFVIGIVAGKGQWFTTFRTRAAYLWGAIGMGVFLSTRILLALFPRLPDMLNWSVVWAGAEAFVCVGVVLGLLACFRERLNTTRSWQHPLFGSVYGVYLIHVFHVVPVQLALVDVVLPVSAKFMLVTLLTVVTSFLSIALLRKIPGFRSVIG